MSVLKVNKIIKLLSQSSLVLINSQVAIVRVIDNPEKSNLIQSPWIKSLSVSGFFILEDSDF